MILDAAQQHFLDQNGYVSIGKMNDNEFNKFNLETKNLIKEALHHCPKGELFNLINSTLELKKKSNEVVNKYLTPFVESKFDMDQVDVYPVSHIIKPFGLKGDIWHQDSAIVNENHDFSLNAWMSFVDSTKFNGCIWVIPGSHKLKNFKRQFGFNPIDKDFMRKIRKYMVPLEAKAGEILLFHRNILHGSSKNWVSKRRIAAECIVVSKNAQFVNYHREEAMHKDKIIAFQVGFSHFIKENPKEDFYSGETPYILYDDETKEDIRAYILNELPKIIVSK